MPQKNSGGAYEKLERKVGDYAVIGVGATITLNDAGTIARAGIGLCNAGETPIKPPAPDNVNEAATLAMQDADPVEDDRGPVDYKRAMVRELTRRALHRALDRARGGN